MKKPKKGDARVWVDPPEVPLKNRFPPGFPSSGMSRMIVMDDEDDEAEARRMTRRQSASKQIINVIRLATRVYESHSGIRTGKTLASEMRKTSEGRELLDGFADKTADELCGAIMSALKARPPSS
jgi:hypothetical protein